MALGRAAKAPQSAVRPPAVAAASVPLMHAPNTSDINTIRPSLIAQIDDGNEAPAVTNARAEFRGVHRARRAVNIRAPFNGFLRTG
jgi:hypothetical protein